MPEQDSGYQPRCSNRQGIIYKYELEQAGTTRVTMPMHSKILSVGVQNENIVLWALVDPDSQMVCQDFFVVPTGVAFEDATARFIGTVMLYGGEHVRHVFELSMNVAHQRYRPQSNIPQSPKGR